MTSRRNAFWGFAALTFISCSCGSNIGQLGSDKDSGTSFSAPSNDVDSCAREDPDTVVLPDKGANAVASHMAPAASPEGNTGSAALSVEQRDRLSSLRRQPGTGPTAGTVAPAGPRPDVERVIIKFRPGSNATARAALHRRNGLMVDRTIPQLLLHAVRIPPGKTADGVIVRYEGHPLVEFTGPDQAYPSAEVTPNDQYYPFAWHLPRIGAPTAWETTTGDTDLIMAIIDSGVDSAHPDLAGKIVPGWNFFDDNTDTSDWGTHGTAVAGAAAAATNNTIGVASVAWGCRIMPLRVSDPANGSASVFDLIDALVWAADHGARIANLSFGGISGNSFLATGFRYFQDRTGGVITTAAGNSGLFDSNPDDPLVLNVSATGTGDLITDFSTWGTSIDVSAPGFLIYTTVPGSYGSAGGTSVAAPIVAGVGALVLSVNPNLDGPAVQEIIKRSADDLGPHGWDPEYGWGRVNAAWAVEMALNYGNVPDETPPSVAIVDPIPGDLLSGIARVEATASDDTGVAQVDLYCDGLLLSSDTVPPHEWWIDTTELTNGDHVLFAVAFDSAGNSAESAAVSVIIENAAQCDCPPDCSEPASSETPGATCDDGLDNDCDGVIDCSDPDCDSDALCFAPGCGNGVCETDESVCDCPSDCGPSPVAEMHCSNVVDDDCDGAVDCDDPDCATDRACADRCGDRFCDAAGGEDRCSCPKDCGKTPRHEVECLNGMDDDCDGLADGDDPDCAMMPGCGNDICEGGGEDCFTCPEDCLCRGDGCLACCGDGICAGPGENRKSCSVDCGR